jgi:hypothetical protein
MPLEFDIVDRIRTDFGDSDSHAAINELDRSGHTGRIARCIVLASHGEMERLRELILAANLDFRDVIVAAEYDGALRQVRDLRVAFLIDSPDDFWIADIATTAHKHGYRLSALQSQSATVGPFDFTADKGEGQATFCKGESTLTVLKRDRH